MQAYADSGLRATVSINHQNLVEYVKYPFLADILPADVKRGMDATRVADHAGACRALSLVSRHVAQRRSGRLRIAVSNSAPQRVSDDYFAFLSDFSRAHDLPFNIHMLETKTQRVLSRPAGANR